MILNRVALQWFCPESALPGTCRSGRSVAASHRIAGPRDRQGSRADRSLILSEGLLRYRFRPVQSHGRGKGSNVLLASAREVM